MTRTVHFTKFWKFGNCLNSEGKPVTAPFDKGDSLEVVGQDSTNYKVVDQKTNKIYFINIKFIDENEF